MDLVARGSSAKELGHSARRLKRFKSTELKCCPKALYALYLKTLVTSDFVIMSPPGIEPGFKV
jgi:hypothetical protein